MYDLDDFDPTDSNAGAKAAERANRLEKALKKCIVELHRLYAHHGSSFPSSPNLEVIYDAEMTIRSGH